jgi:hypothetical protein
MLYISGMPGHAAGVGTGAEGPCAGRLHAVAGRPHLRYEPALLQVCVGGDCCSSCSPWVEPFHCCRDCYPQVWRSSMYVAMYVLISFAAAVAPPQWAPVLERQARRPVAGCACVLAAMYVANVAQVVDGGVAAERLAPDDPRQKSSVLISCAGMARPVGTRLNTAGWAMSCGLPSLGGGFNTTDSLTSRPLTALARAANPPSPMQ